MAVLKKIYRFLSSMRFAIILLVILAAACILASFIPQGKDADWYAATYSPRIAALITWFKIDDAFHSWWFLAITAFLCLNLLFCNLIRLTPLIRRTKDFASPGDPALADAVASEVSDPEAAFSRMRFRTPARRTQEGTETLYACKNRAGLWGAWVCHLGILLLIVGFTLGQLLKVEYVVYGVPGQTRMIGDTELALTIDDFHVNLRDDDTVEQYVADITVRSLSEAHIGESRSASISVNNPANLFGMKFYQNATGWAARVSVEKDGEPLESEIVCAGEGLHMADNTNLVVFFNAFYPDYVFDPDNGPMTASGTLKNPAYLYSIYYGEDPVGMNVLENGETIKVNSYEIAFSDPQNYTLIQVKKDPYTWIALVGGLITMLGLFLALYVLPERVWAIRAEDGTWTMYGISKKRGTLYREAFLHAVTGETNP